MLLGNPAVLRGHPLLPALLVTAVVVGLLWAVLLWRRRRVSRKRSALRAAGAWVGRVAVLALVAMLVWLNPFAYQQGAVAAGSSPSASVVDEPTAIVMRPDGAPVSKGLVFYPGARVEARAYADILKPAVDAGVLVVILKAPLNLSLLDGNQARGVMEAHPEISTWTVGGHSLGGVSASSFALSSQDVDGLLLYASYPLDSMRDRAGRRTGSVRRRRSTPPANCCPRTPHLWRFRAVTTRSSGTTDRSPATANLPWTATLPRTRSHPPRLPS
jgi:hypothetical protein